MRRHKGRVRAENSCFGASERDCGASAGPGSVSRMLGSTEEEDGWREGRTDGGMESGRTERRSVCQRRSHPGLQVKNNYYSTPAVLFLFIYNSANLHHILCQMTLNLNKTSSALIYCDSG